MSEPWTAQHRVDEKWAKELIEGQFPALAPAMLIFVGEGWDNTVYRVNDDFLFRFPRRQFGANCILIESIALPHLAKQLPLPIPEPIFFGQPTTTYPWTFLGYHFLAGQSACGAQLSDAERMPLAKPLAEFLKALHAIPIDQAQALGVQHDQHQRLDVPFRLPTAYENVAKIKALGLFSDCEKLISVIDELKDVRDHEPKTLTHGDLYARHLLIDEHRELAGVIDWGDLLIANPALDLAIVYSFLPPTAHNDFFNSYGPVKIETKQLACLKALYHNAILANYAHSIGDTLLLKESLKAFAFIAAYAGKDWAC